MITYLQGSMRISDTTINRTVKKDETIMNRKIIAIIVLGLVLLASLLACGYFGMKTVRRTRLRHAAMEAYEKKDYILAERLLHAYVRQDPNAEAEYVALANVYRAFGDTEKEAQMWQSASSLNPLNPEYYENMLNSAMKSASYQLLHSILGRKAKIGETFTDQELYLYVISSYRSDYQKDGDDAYQKAVEADPEAFHKNELGRMAEFMVKYQKLSEAERNEFLNQAIESEDPVVRFEALYTAFSRLRQRIGNETGHETEIEAFLKQIVETNYFVGTQLLANYYYSNFRFSDAIDILEPYLKTIDDINLYLLYEESCVFEGKLDELKALEKKLRRRPDSLSILADYCEMLIPYMEKDEEKLSAAVRKSGKIVNTPLSRFIRLRVAMTNDSINEIQTVAQEIFSSEPFHDLHNRALFVCLTYLSRKMQKPENQNDPSQMAELAKILSGHVSGNRLLTDIILTDQYKKGLAKEAELMAAVEQFPDDALLQQVAAEYLILNGKAEQALDILEQTLANLEAEKQENAEEQKSSEEQETNEDQEASEEEEADEDQQANEEEMKNFSNKTRFLKMLALDQLGRRNDAAIIFQSLVEQTEFDVELLAQYFLFCVKDKREEDLISMANKLDSVKDGKLDHYGKFFRAAALLVEIDVNKTEGETEEETEEDQKVKEALDLLASTPTGDPEFTLYAANRLSDHSRLDEAEAKYKAILKTYHTPPLILINLSELYHERGDEAKALDTAKEAFELEKSSVSMLPAFIYAKRLSEADRYEDAVGILNFPRRSVNYREDVVELWVDCMHHVIEKSIAEERFSQAEEQCKHLLTISPDDAFGKENLEKVQKLIKQQNVKAHSEQTAPAA